jgi:ectoine hydroxylase-related dioxygenase (phytanoyl-CoA dioxygenase family)
MGAAIHALVTQIMIRPPNPKPTSRWHRDTMAPYGFPSAAGAAPLQQFRIGWFLTDLPEPDMGNLCVLPGSHRRGFPDIEQGADHAERLTSFSRYLELDDVCEGLPDARQVTVAAGDAVVFHNALFHAVARNASTVSRKNLYYVYGPWWARLSDRMVVTPEAAALCNPIQRQLIGATLEPRAAAPTSADERLPLIKAFEGRTFQEVFDREARRHVSGTQHRSP